MQKAYNLNKINIWRLIDNEEKLTGLWIEADELRCWGKPVVEVIATVEVVLASYSDRLLLAPSWLLTLLLSLIRYQMQKESFRNRKTVICVVFFNDKLQGVIFN